MLAFLNTNPTYLSSDLLDVSKSAGGVTDGNSYDVGLFTARNNGKDAISTKDGTVEISKELGAQIDAAIERGDWDEVNRLTAQFR